MLLLSIVCRKSLAYRYFARNSQFLMKHYSDLPIGPNNPTNQPTRVTKPSAPSSSAPKRPKPLVETKVNEVLSEGVRVNKCVVSLSRRGADEAVAQNRVTVNGVLATATQRIKPGDMVRLDGKVQHWERVNLAKRSLSMQTQLEDRDFIYLKYHKPVGMCK